MNATVNRRGEIVLQTSVREKPCVKTGDVLVVVHDRAGRIVLQKRSVARRHRSAKSYLTPAVLPAAALNRVYTYSDPAWDKVEAEAAALSRRALRGKALEDL